jgi:hypothetical protein
MPLFYAMLDREPNEVIVDHFMNSVVTRRGQREWHEYVDIECDALRAIFLMRMNANVGVDDIVPQKDPAAIGEPGIEQRVHGWPPL